MNSYWNNRVKKAMHAIAHADVRPGVIGYRRNGTPIFTISGGDDIASAVAEVKTAFEKTQNDMATMLEKQREEMKAFGTTTDETKASLVEAIKRYDEQLESLQEAQKKVNEEVTDLLTKTARLWTPGNGEDAKSIGATFVESEAYKAYVPNGEPHRGPSGSVQVGKQVKALMTGASLGDIASYLYDTTRLAGIIAAPDRMDRVRSLLPVNRTTSGAIEWIRETGFTNAATVVPEGANNKPESALTFDIVIDSVKTVAHWLPVTRQILSDAPALEDYINNRLIIGLKLAEDQQLLNGSGIGANMVGLLNTPDIQEYAISEDADNNAAPQTKLDAIRRAILKARVAEYPATGVVLNPNDWADIELLKGEDSHYIWVNVNDGGQQRVWRVPVVDTTAIPVGTGLTGAFSLGAAVWDREDAEIRATDSHGTMFIQNTWVILAEERLLLTVYRPEAFVKIDFEDAS